MELRDRVALITGGSGGLGSVTACIFADEGVHFAVTRLSLLKEVVPGLARLGLVFHSSTRGLQGLLKTIEREAATMGIEVVWLEIAGPETIGTLRQGIRAARVHALSTLDHPVTDGLSPRIAEIALQERLPYGVPVQGGC